MTTRRLEVNFVEDLDVVEDIVVEAKFLKGFVNTLEVGEATGLGGGVTSEEAEGRLTDLLVECTRVVAKQLPDEVLALVVPLDETQIDRQVLRVPKRSAASRELEGGGGNVQDACKPERLVRDST